MPSPRPLPPRTTPLAALPPGADVRPGVAAWLRWGTPPPEPGCAWSDADGSVVAVVRRRRAYGTGLFVVAVGDAPAASVVATVRELAAGSGADFVTVERGACADTLARAGSGPAGWGAPAKWDWMWTAAAPPAVPGEDRVVPLDPADHAEVAALLQAESPRHSAEPGEPQVRGWVGVRDPDGTLVACGADYEAVPGVPLLASVAVRGRARGQGLGAAVTAVLTRRSLAAGAPVVTVDLYADNDSARRLYARLGFRLAVEFASFELSGA